VGLKLTRKDNVLKDNLCSIKYLETLIGDLSNTNETKQLSLALNI